MDECETYNCSPSPKVVQDTASPSYSAIYDNEEFYPEEEETSENIHHYHNNDDLLDEKEEYYEEVNCMDPEEEQKRLEKTIFHKAMIGIGPYLVQKARTVLDETTSQQQLDVVTEEDGQEDWTTDQRKNKYGPHKKKHSPEANRNRRHSHSHVPIANSRSQSFTKGLHQKIRGSGSRTQTRQVRPGSRGFKLQHRCGATTNNNRATNKCSSTSSLGGGEGQKQEQSPLKVPQHYDNSIGQRLASARRMQIKELKSRVTLLENLLTESRQETRTLTRMQHRHQIALSKYEGTEAELPKMIRSHVAEVRSLQENLRKAHNQNRVSDEKLKVRDQKIFRLEDENKSLMALVKQNNLEERSKLSEQLEQARIDHKTVEMKVSDLQRHVEILEKNHRHQISVETKKLKTTNNKLFEAHQEIDKLIMALKEKDRTLTCMRIRQGQTPTGKVRTCDMTKMPIFRDDLSVRSARTLPHKSTRIRPTDNASSSPHCEHDHEQLRRQRSETCGPHNRKPARFSKFSTMNKAYLYNSNENASYDESSAYENEQQFQKQQESRQTPHHHYHHHNYVDNNNIESDTHLDIDTGGGGGSMSLTPTSHRSSPQCRSVHTHSSQRRIFSTGHKTEDNSQLESLPTNNNNDDDDGDDDEYFNFEDVSVEDDTNYRPHKSLFMDALDSSCNVSSMGQSPLDSMRSNHQQQQLPFAASPSCKSLRPSSAGPKFRLAPKKQSAAAVAGKLVSAIKSSLPREPDNNNNSDDNNIMISSIQCPSALQSPVSVGICDIDLELGDCNNISSSDSPPKKTKRSPPQNNGQQGGTGGGGDGPSTTDPEPGFISQRPSVAEEDQIEEQENRSTSTTKKHSQDSHNGQKKFSSMTSSSSSSSSSSCEDSDKPMVSDQVHCHHSTTNSTNVKTFGKPKSKSEAHLSSSSFETSAQNVPIIEAMFTKWKKNKRSLLEDNSGNTHHEKQHQLLSSTDSTVNSQKQPQEQMTPRRKEALLQKIKEIDATNKSRQTLKKTDEKVSLSNPAYFDKVPENKSYDRHAVDLLDKPPSQLFKPSLYQPFFNNNNTTTTTSSSIDKKTSAAASTVEKTNPVLPWLNSTTTTTPETSVDNNVNKKKNKEQESSGSEKSEGERSGLRIQHSSILEPRHTLPMFVNGSSPKTSPRKSSIECGPPQDNTTTTSTSSDFGSQDIPRKKFSIGTISSLQDGQGHQGINVQSSLTSTKNKPIGLGPGGRSKQWK